MKKYIIPSLNGEMKLIDPSLEVLEIVKPNIEEDDTIDAIINISKEGVFSLDFYLLRVKVSSGSAPDETLKSEILKEFNNQFKQP